ncbi:uncharacterized protein LOC112679702 [Sipha flava]|uniref:Uncharacterized protein LOC112679702 n=1 Tax=Sipha flava TaxID=143950 RepID=A0A8B8F458_9HEMI|nr:uncharacterized protein LOC112679702 [Sipha flava]
MRLKGGAGSSTGSDVTNPKIDTIMDVIEAQESSRTRRIVSEEYEGIALEFEETAGKLLRNNTDKKVDFTAKKKKSKSRAGVLLTTDTEEEVINRINRKGRRRGKKTKSTRELYTESDTSSSRSRSRKEREKDILEKCKEQGVQTKYIVSNIKEISKDLLWTEVVKKNKAPKLKEARMLNHAAKCKQETEVCAYCAKEGHRMDNCPNKNKDPVCANCRGPYTARHKCSNRGHYDIS